MDKPKNKDGMLAAGKKRLEQFRQKKQGKGSSVKGSKSEIDIEHGKPGIDIEHGSAKGSKVKIDTEHTLSQNFQATNDRSDVGGDGTLIDLRIVRADDTEPQIGMEHVSAVEMEHGPANVSKPGVYVEHALESHFENSTLEQEDLTIGSGGVSMPNVVEISVQHGSPKPSNLKNDSMHTLELHLMNSPAGTGYFEPAPTGNEGQSSSSSFNSGGAGMPPDSIINMADLVVPKVDVEHGLMNDVGHMPESNHETSVIGSGDSEHVEAAQMCDEEQLTTSSSEIGLTGILPVSSTDEPDTIGAETNSEHCFEKACELDVAIEHNRELNPKDTLTGSNYSEHAKTSQIWVGLQSTSNNSDSGAVGWSPELRVDQEDTLGPKTDSDSGVVGVSLDSEEASNRNLENNFAASGYSEHAVNAARMWNQEQSISSRSDIVVAGMLQSDAVGPEINEIDLKYGSGKASVLEYGAEHTLELNSQNSFSGSGFTEHAKIEQTWNEKESATTSSNSDVVRMPLDSSLNQAGVETNIECGAKLETGFEHPSESNLETLQILSTDEPTDDSYEAGMPLVSGVDITSIAGLEVAINPEASKLEDDTVHTWGLNFEDSFIGSGPLEETETAQSSSTGETTDGRFGLQVQVDKAGGEPHSDHVSAGRSNLDCVMDSILESNVEKSFTSLGSYEDTKAGQGSKEDEVANVRSDKTDAVGTEFDPEHGTEGVSKFRGVITPILDSTLEDNFNCCRSFESIEATQSLEEDESVNAKIVGAVVAVEHILELNLPKTITGSGAFEHTETSHSSNEDQLNISSFNSGSGAFEHTETAQSSNEDQLNISSFNSGSRAVMLLDSTIDMSGAAGLGSDVEYSYADPGVVHTLNLGLGSSEHVEKVQGFVEEAMANRSSDSCGAEMALQLRMDKVQEELDMGHDVAKEVGIPTIEMESTSGSNNEISLASLEHKESTQILNQAELACCRTEIHSTELSLDSTIDETDIVLSKLDAENGLAKAIDQETIDVLSGNSDTASESLQHHVETTESVLPSLKPETETQASDSGTFGPNGSAGLLNADDSTNIIPDNLRAGMSLDLTGNANVFNHETVSEPHSANAEHILEPNSSERVLDREESLYAAAESSGDVVLADKTQVAGSNISVEHDSAEASEVELDVQFTLRSKLEGNFCSLGFCESDKDTSVISSSASCEIGLPLDLSPKKVHGTVGTETEHSSAKSFSQELCRELTLDFNQIGTTASTFMSKEMGHSLNEDESRVSGNCDFGLPLSVRIEETDDVRNEINLEPEIAVVHTSKTNFGGSGYVEDMDVGLFPREVESTNGRFEGDWRLDKTQIFGFSRSLCLEEKSFGNKEVIEEKTGLEDVVRELQDLLCMKETELEELTLKFNSQAAKANEERGAAVKILMHVLKRLSHLVPQQLKVNEEDDLLIECPGQLDVDGGETQEARPSSVTLECLLQDSNNWIDELWKDLEEKRHMESMVRQYEENLSRMETDKEGLTKKVTELSQNYDYLQKDLEEKRQMENKARQLEDLLSIRETDMEGLSQKVSELSQNYDLVTVEVANAAEEKIKLECELKHFQKLYAEQEELRLRLCSQASSLSGKLSAVLRDSSTDMETIDSDAMGFLEYSVASLLGQYETTHRENKDLLQGASDSDAAHEVERENLKALMVSKEVELSHFQEQITFLTSELGKAREDGERKVQQAEQKLLGVREKLSLAVTKGKGLVQQRDNLKQLLAEKTAEIEALASYKQELQLKGVALHEAESKVKLYAEAVERVEALESELSYIRNSANALRESFLQKDAVLQKIEELLEDTSLPEELQLKDIFEKVEWLIEAYSQKNLILEGQDHSQTVTARELDLSNTESASQRQEIEELNRKCDDLLRKYRGMAEQSAMLEQSLLERNLLIQRWEEVLDAIDMPAAVRSKEPEDKIEWLGRAVSDAHTHTAQLELETERSQVTIDSLNLSIQKLQEENHVILVKLAAKNDELRRWEEVLVDAIDMPDAVRSKDPEDRIEWLGGAVSDAHTRTAQFQLETERSQVTIDALNLALQKLQEENCVISVELAAKNDELKTMAMDLEDMTLKYNSSPKPASQGSFETGMEISQAGLPDSQEREHEQEANQQMQFPYQITELEALVTNIRSMLGEVVQGDEVDRIFSGASGSTVLESSVKLLVENCKVLSANAADMKVKVEELLLASSVVEKEREWELQSLHEALRLKTIEASNLNLQIQEFITRKSVLEDEVDGLRNQVKALTEELFFVRDELTKSQLESSQAEEKLTSVREKLSMAVKKGKSVVQQRDALRQSLEEKTAELSQMNKEHQAESLALNKAEQSLKHLVQQVEMLEAELSSSREYALSMERSLQESNRAFQKFAEALDKVSILGSPRSGDLVEKVQWLSQAVVDAQRKAGVSEQEAKKSKTAVELLALELEEVQGRMDSLTDELMHAEKNISILTEEKKIAEAGKAEAGLRLEHAMANINSLLFELSESRESEGNLEQENSSLKDALAAQMEEIRYKQTKAEEQLKDLADLYNKVHALQDHQVSLFGMVADEVLQLTEDIRRAKVLAIKLSGEFTSLKDQSANPFSTAHHAFVEDPPSKWQSEFLISGNRSQDWKQGITTGSLILRCEEMEIELQRFGDFFRNFIAASTQDSVGISQLLLEICDGLGFILQKMESLKKDADLATSSESLRLQKDKQIANLEADFKAVVEMVKSLVEEVEALKMQAQGQVPWSGISSRESLEDNMVHMESKDLHTLAASLAERLYSTVKDLTHLHEQERIASEKRSEDLRDRLGEAKAVIDATNQQQQLDKLKISELQKYLEEFEVNEDMLKRTNQELYSLHDVLSIKRQEEEGLVQALNKAETKIGELSTKVEELEKENQELEASLGKASSRFSTTVNNFNKFQRLSEKLIEEAESLHLLLEGRDAQISQLREEVNLKRSEVTSLHNLVDEKTADLSQLHQQIQEIVGKDIGGSELLTDAGPEREAGSAKELLETLAACVQTGRENLRIQLARKDALLQDVQMRHDELAGKVTFLQASFQGNQRLMDERGHTHIAERAVITTEADEMGNRGKHIVPPVAVVTHGRGGRKVSASDHLSLDVDMEPSRSLVDLDDDDKGHVFKPLTSSRLVPRGTRFLVDRIDGFWVSGERLLMRKPEARLSIMLYWLVLHIWMAMLLL